MAGLRRRAVEREVRGKEGAEGRAGGEADLQHHLGNMPLGCVSEDLSRKIYPRREAPA